MTRFLLIRHASCDTVGRVLSGRRPGVHLNARGVEEARRLAAALGRAAPATPIHALYTSPLERARETAAPLAEALSLEPRASAALDEVDVGAWAGRTFEELQGEAEWGRWNAVRSASRAPGGESALDVAARVIGGLEELRRRHGDEAVALVTHQDVIRTALAHLAGIPMDLMLRLEVAPASVSVVDLADWGVRIVAVNQILDHPHPWPPGAC